MPLRDHFRRPLNKKHQWTSLHGGWPMIIVANLKKHLPRRYRAALQVHSGTSAEIDVAAYDDEQLSSASVINGENGGVATAVWAPPRPTLTFACDLPAQDEYEVLIFDESSQSRLVAAVEIVSPSNKDRPQSRRAFAAKCAAMLRERVSVVIVDIVTTRTPNLYGELLAMIDVSDPALVAEQSIYTSACRFTKHEDEWTLETWLQPLTLGQPLPTMPLWLADNLAVPLELEASYEQSCEILGIA